MSGSTASDSGGSPVNDGKDDFFKEGFLQVKVFDGVLGSTASLRSQFRHMKRNPFVNQQLLQVHCHAEFQEIIFLYR